MKIINETEIDGGRKIEFEFEGKSCIVCVPANPLPEKCVIWRTEFFGAFDCFDRMMLERGYYRAYIGLSNQFGSPYAVEMMKKFHDFLVSSFDITPKAVLVGLSRGGLYAVNYAAEYPEDVGALYLDAPVLSVANWPFGKGRTPRNEAEVELALEAYGMSERELLEGKHHPLCKAEKIAKAQIPIVFVCGDSDETVDHRDNTESFMTDFKAHGGYCEYYLKPGCAHHPHGLENPVPIIDFIEKNVR